MSDFVTADCHFGHTNIIEYCGRPFSSIHEMNFELTRRWNSVVTQSDTVYILGDFAMGNKASIPTYANKLNGRKILILGNHDRKKLEVFEPTYKSLIYSSEIFMIHNPRLVEPSMLTSQKTILCGHVHTAWKSRTIDELLYINVGVDQWNFTPQLISDIVL